MRSLAAFGTPLSSSHSWIWENTLGSISIEDAFSLVCLAVMVFPLLWKFVIVPANQLKEAGPPALCWPNGGDCCCLVFRHLL